MKVSYFKHFGAYASGAALAKALEHFAQELKPDTRYELEHQIVSVSYSSRGDYHEAIVEYTLT